MDGNKEWKEPLLPDNDGGRFWWLARLQNDLLAEEPDELEQVMIKEIIDQENR